MVVTLGIRPSHGHWINSKLLCLSAGRYVDAELYMCLFYISYTCLSGERYVDEELYMFILHILYMAIWRTLRG